MSRRRSRRRRPTFALPAWVATLLPVAAAVLGWVFAPWLLSHLGPPVALDPAVWTVIVPGRDETMADETLVSGTGLVDGALHISVRGLTRSDILRPTVNGKVGAMDLGIARESGPFFVNVHGAGGQIARAAEFGPDGWRRDPSQAWLPYARPGLVRLDLTGTSATVDGTGAGPGASGDVEIVAVDAPAALSHLTLTDTAGAVMVDEDFGLADPGWVGRALFALLGGGLATLVAYVARRADTASGRLLALLFVVPSAVVPFVRYADWRVVCERLYLLHTAASTLRMACFALGFVPLFAAAVLVSGRLPLHPGEPQRRAFSFGLFVALLVAIDLEACRALEGWAYLWAIPGLAFLLLPWRAARALALPADRVLARDLPALAAVAVLGWGPGLVPAALWRLLCLLADAPVLARQGARVGADAAFVLLACLPLGVESAVRWSYLDDAWDPIKLAGTSVGEAGRSADFSPFFDANCAKGKADAVYTFGGSSAGGAFQFEGKPVAFFPVRVHQRLCAEGRSIRTLDYGNSGRDSWDAATAVDGLFASTPPAAVMLYLGVNDLLTADSPYTRKERAARMAERAEAANKLDALSSSIRTLTGLSLLLRPAPGSQQAVVAVPIQDAEENLRHIQAAAARSHAQVLLIPEYTQPDVDGVLGPYWAMERRLAAELPGVRYVDLRKRLGANGTTYLIDRNHLNRAGSDKIGEVIAPIVSDMLDGKPAASPDP